MFPKNRSSVYSGGGGGGTFVVLDFFPIDSLTGSSVSSKAEDLRLDDSIFAASRILFYLLFFFNCS